AGGYQTRGRRGLLPRLQSAKCITKFPPFEFPSVKSASINPDPFYVVRGEVQDSIDRLLASFQQWEHTASGTGVHARLSKELLTDCESLEWQVDELDKAIAVASRDPARYKIHEAELQNRRRWTKAARDQVGSVREAISTGNKVTDQDYGTAKGAHKELMILPVNPTLQEDRSNQYVQDNDDFIASESDRQLLLIKQQDEELDEVIASVQRIGNFGLTIHDELHAQEKIIDELGMDMDSTSNRLEFVQKKVGMVMKKAGAKGQIMMMLVLLVLFIILFVLVFLT
ncbi:hypothetical protein Dimus_018082, partial [Dionaea muscipula]